MRAVTAGQFNTVHNFALPKRTVRALFCKNHHCSSRSLPLDSLLLTRSFIPTPQWPRRTTKLRPLLKLTLRSHAAGWPLRAGEIFSRVRPVGRAQKIESLVVPCIGFFLLCFVTYIASSCFALTFVWLCFVAHIARAGVFSRRSFTSTRARTCRAEPLARAT